MKADVVCACVGKGRGHGIDRLHHQVYVHGYVDHVAVAIGLFGMRLDGLADHGAEGQVGHVMVVHHVKVHPVCARSYDVFNLFTQPRKVSRQNGRGDAESGGVGSTHGLDCRMRM